MWPHHGPARKAAVLGGARPSSISSFAVSELEILRVRERRGHLAWCRSGCCCFQDACTRCGGDDTVNLEVCSARQGGVRRFAGRGAAAELDINTRTRNSLLRSLRCLGERGFALLTGRWRTLQHITASAGKIGDIAAQRSSLPISNMATSNENR